MKINLSGHFNQSLEEVGFSFPGTLQMNMSASYADNLRNVIAFLVAQGIKSDTVVTVALPGMNALASMVIVALHGLTGQFPKLA